MNRSYSQIHREVGNAVDYVRANGGAVADNSVAEQIEAGQQNHELSDRDLVDYEEDLPVAAPNVVRAATLDELLMVYDALGRIHHGIDQWKIDKDISHEKRHKAAADRIGFRHSVHEVQLTESRETPTPQGLAIQFGWRPSVRQAGPINGVTKLASASIVAAPANLSDGDLARLNAMGYEGQDDVAQRIMTATDPQLASLLLPEHSRPY